MLNAAGESVYKRVKIVGIWIDCVTKDEMIGIMNTCLSKEGNSLFVATVNPSFVLYAEKYPHFSDILNHETSINTSDGVGIQLAAEYIFSVNNNLRFKYKFYNINRAFFLITNLFLGISMGIKFIFGRIVFNVIPDRITGTFLAHYLLNLANLKGYRVLIVHRSDSLTSKETLQNYINTKYPKLKYVIYSVSIGTKDKSGSKTLHDTLNSDITLCTFGEVAQELFYVKNRKFIKTKIFIGIGGAFDLLTKSFDYQDSTKGYDWFYRVLDNPKRVKKLIKSIFVFPLLVFLSLLNNKSK